MTEQPTTAAIARTFTETWTRHDMDATAGYLAEDVTFEGPVGHSVGKQAYVEGLSKFAQLVSGVKILAALGDDTQALIMYELATPKFGTLTCAEWLTFRDGKIAADRFTYDTFPVRGGAAATSQAPSAPNPPAPAE
ncbi:MAG TPA: nuclear transport factor 2 family protein [Ktedonobacterales bacterium]|nr:nuclear transport factor 2 family protein [Ktedonobacterales bacterium]